MFLRCWDLPSSLVSWNGRKVLAISFPASSLTIRAVPGPESEPWASILVQSWFNITKVAPSFLREASSGQQLLVGVLVPSSGTSQEIYTTSSNRYKEYLDYIWWPLYSASLALPAKIADFLFSSEKETRSFSKQWFPLPASALSWGGWIGKQTIHRKELSYDLTEAGWWYFCISSSAGKLLQSWHSLSVSRLVVCISVTGSSIAHS